MSKWIKRIAVLIAIVGMVIGVIGIPQVSEAAYTYSYPATTVYVELVNKQGEDFPLPLNMEAVDLRGLYPRKYGAVWTNMSATPLTITKVGGKNVFAFHLPEVSSTTVPDSWSYYQMVANIKIVTPLTTVNKLQWSTAFRQYQTLEDKLGSVFITPAHLSDSASRFTRNGDNTWNLDMGHDDPNPEPPGYRKRNFGTRKLDNEATAPSPSPKFTALGLDGDRVKLQLIAPQIREMFEDETGATIPVPPGGYTNNNYIDIIDQPFTYQMNNGSSLPKTYTDSGFIYTYKGWYHGAGNKGSIITAHPPSIGFNALDVADSQNEVHIVYNKRAIRTLDEEYIDTSSATIEPSWNNMGQTTADGDTFNQTPAATKTDSSGTEWEYLGWKLGSEPMSAMKTTPVSHVISANTTIQYVYQKKQHMITEKWVDQADGTTLVPMTGNPKSNAVDDNDPFSGSPAATITDSGGGIWDYTGWENATDAAGTVNSAASFTINNIKGGKEIRYHYQARNTTANLDLNPTPQVVASGGTVAWSSRLTNTGTSTLNNLTLKATSNWASGLSAPTQVTVTPAGGAPQNFTVSPVDWAGGFNLTGVSIPSGGPNNYADITFTDTATGAVNQVLPAEIEIDGNMASPLTAENFVRIDDPDELNLNPSGNAGLINIPKFEFGDVEVKPFAQTKGLDAASYQAGYNPYIRYKDQESLVGWDLTVKLSQFTSGSKTLPTTTSIKLNNGDLKEVHNYNKGNESLSSVGSIGNKTIFSDGTTVALTNGTAQGVYQLDYAFNDVELELLAHSGIAGLRYEANMDWTLTTTP